MDKLKLVIVMLIWGSISVISRYIDLSPLLLALFRALIALPVLIGLIFSKKIKAKFTLNQALPYIVTGVLLGIGWATFFYGVKNASISSAVLIYNLGPIYVMIAAPIVLKEKLTLPKALAIIISFIGLFFVVSGKSLEKGESLGLLSSGISGLCYALIVLINRKTKHKIDNNLSTLIQVLAAAIILLPITFLTEGFSSVQGLDAKTIILVLLLGVVHTGIAYNLYFSVYKKLKSIEIVSFCFLEPIFGIILSIMFLAERITLMQLLGGVLILGSTFLGEYLQSRKIRIKMSVNIKDDYHTISDTEL